MELLPNEILYTILIFIEDSFALLLVCKRFRNLLRTNELYWKHISLEFWSNFVQGLDMSQKRSCLFEGELELAQKESGKDW
jgi:hypothetical protein